MIRSALAAGLASLALPFSLMESSAPVRSADELRLPALTAYASPDPGVRFPRNGEVAPFAKPGTSLLWFGEFKSAGMVSASIELMAPQGVRVTVRLVVAGEPHDTVWRGDWDRAPAAQREVSVVGTGAMQRVLAGDFAIAAPGYARFALSASEVSASENSAVSGRGAAPNVKVAALVLDGGPTANAHFNLLPRRNAASVHLRYPTDSTALITGFYNEVTAVDDPVTTYYMATGFARGYFGMQVNSPTERRIIFSVWDAGAGTNANDRSTVALTDQTQLVGKGEGVVADVFGNEGTGGHSHLVYDWKTGSTQRFFVTAAVDGTHTTYSGYWFHPDKKAWMLIASFRAPNDGKGLRRLYSFSENFGGETGHLRRKALFGPSWIRLASGEWQELTTVTFSHDVTGRADRFDRWMGVENGRFFLQHGGFVSGFTETGTAFTRSPSNVPPRDTP